MQQNILLHIGMITPNIQDPPVVWAMALQWIRKKFAVSLSFFFSWENYYNPMSFFTKVSLTFDFLIDISNKDIYIYSHLSNNVESTLTYFEKFHPPLLFQPPHFAQMVYFLRKSCLLFSFWMIKLTFIKDMRVSKQWKTRENQAAVYIIEQFVLQETFLSLKLRAISNQ